MKVDNRVRINSFFTGIGGFDLAFEQNGFTANFFCENSRYCRSVLQRHWPSVPIAKDIRRLQASEVPKAPIWTAGFPCQDLSLAKAPHGRTGFRGNQSSLFFTFQKLVAEHRPEVVLLENVTGLLNSHRGEDFQLLLEGLTDLGYGVAWRVLNARYFGVPQSRSRVFICAWLGSPSKAVSALYEKDRAIQPKRERDGFLQATVCPITGAHVPKTSFCISATSARHTGLDWARTYVAYDFGVRRPTPLETERLQGFPDFWTLPSKDYVIPFKGIDTERYRAAGNAVAVPVVSWIAKRINSLLSLANQNRKEIKISKGCIDLATLASEFKIEAFSHSLRNNKNPLKWQRGGVAWGNDVVHAATATAPVKPIDSYFVDILERTDISQRYFLSPNAARGIVQRVERRGRTLFPPLHKSLTQLIHREPISGARQLAIAL